MKSPIRWTPALLMLLLAGPAVAQVAAPPALTTNPNLYTGAVPQGEPAAQPLDLSLAEAIRLGVQRNLGPILATETQRYARGARLIALSRLLPDLSATVDGASQQINLAAFGFPHIAGFPSVAGPFETIDARFKLKQELLNLRYLYEHRASDQQLTAANLSAEDARDMVVSVVAALYWQAVASESRITAAQAQVTTAEAAYKQAEDQRTAGVAPAIDALRAQVELQAERQRLIADQLDFEKQKLALQQAIGIPAAQQIHLTNILEFRQAEPLTPDQAIDQAYQTRKDYQSQMALLKAAELTRKSASAARLPTINFDGNYGILGSSPLSSHGTYEAKLGLTIPIFAGGAERGYELETDSQLARQRAVVDELRARIGFEVRSVMLDLDSAAQQVAVNRSAVDLARRQETQARDRFTAGVTNNLEVVQAQQGLAAANENYIASLFAYNLARVRLARAIGGTEKNLSSWGILQ